MRGKSILRGEGRGLWKGRLARRVVLVGVAIFTVVVAGVVAIYSMREGRFHLEYSISRYVGQEGWSAVIFGVGNLGISWCLVQYIMLEGGRYGRIWKILMGVMVGCFVGLSLYPIGLFDANYGDYGVVSVLHQIFSRGMFGVMAGAAVVMGYGRRGEKGFLGVCIAYAIYAVVCAAMSVATKVFWDWNFLLESLYIYWFYLILVI